MAKRNKLVKKQKTSSKKRALKLWHKLLRYLFYLVVLITVIGGIFIYIVMQDLPNIANILDENKTTIVTIKDVNGIVLAKYGDLHGQSLIHKQIPKHLIEAVIATEDRRFYSHIGIDVIGLLRAAYVNHRAGRIVQGGSTLTQQLAKISLLTPERTLYRKIQEALLALEIESKFSKKEIISMYLNRVYLGRGNYGVDAASRFYFGKQASDMNLSEAAILAGMLKSPNKLSPANDETASLKRAKQVLFNMEDEGYITIKDIQSLTPPNIIHRGDGRGALQNPYFADYVMEILPDLIGPIERNLTVYTTLDLAMQNKLESTLSHIISTHGKQNKVEQGAAVTIDSFGAIKAWVGGTSYRLSQFDRVNQAKRQPGSAFKIFVYIAALESGIKLDDKFIDAPLSIGKWRPRNFSRDYKGAITLQEAFALSINTVAVRLSEQVGRSKVAEAAHNLGVKEELQLLPSLALGTSEVPLLQMTGAYASIAANGHRLAPTAILKVIEHNKVIYSHTPTVGPKSLSDSVVNSIRNLMKQSVDNGTSRAAAIEGLSVYGKTGTSQDYRDAWFFGFAQGITTGVWLGNDDNTPMHKLTGGKLPALLWKEYMTQIVGKTALNKPAIKSNWLNLFSSKKEKSDTISQVIAKSKKRK